MAVGNLEFTVLVSVMLFFSFFFLIHFWGIEEGLFNLSKVRSGVSFQPVYILCVFSVSVMWYSKVLNLSYYRNCRPRQVFMLNLVQSSHFHCDHPPMLTSLKKFF